ncbi:MAG: DUF302 domain-containing protein [Burkholderiales bacterium]
MNAFPARFAGALAASALAFAALAQAPESTKSVATRHPFDALLERLERAVEKNGLGVVAMASASRGAAARGVKIPGNAVVMVFRNDLAVRLLAASVPAGVEAPLRLYVTENRDGTAALSFRAPSALFAPYRNPEVDRLARELDAILERIAQDATGG